MYSHCKEFKEKTEELRLGKKIIFDLEAVLPNASMPCSATIVYFILENRTSFPQPKEYVFYMHYDGYMKNPSC